MNRTHIHGIVVQMGSQAVASNKFKKYIDETIDCLTFMSAIMQALLVHKSVDEMENCGLLNGSPSVNLRFVHMLRQFADKWHGIDH